MAHAIQKAAMEIVLQEEADRGWRAQALGSVSAEKQHGCDILSMPADGGPPHPVEVKGWSEPLRSSSGRFIYHQDIRTSQFEAAQLDDNYRVEVVANLAAFLAAAGPYERLTLTAPEIRARATPRLYDVPLEGLEGKIRTGGAPGPTDTASPGE